MTETLVHLIKGIEMRTLKSLWSDERGSVLSAEMVALATIAILGVTVGATTAVNAIAAEFADFAQMMRSLDQSFGYGSISCSSAAAAGSSYTDNVSADVAAVQFQAISPQAVNDIAAGFALQTRSGGNAQAQETEKQIDELLQDNDAKAKSNSSNAVPLKLDPHCEI